MQYSLLRLEDLIYLISMTFYDKLDSGNFLRFIFSHHTGVVVTINNLLSTTIIGGPV